MAIIEIRNLSKRYKYGDSSILALNKINLNINKGEISAIVGPSGSGKTTLLNIIGGLETSSEGEIIVSGTNLTSVDERKATIFRRDTIGFVFQLHNLVPYLTAFENIELPLIAKGIRKKERVEQVEKLLTQVDLNKRKHHLPGKLSGGEQQRVAIARALANNPTVILADEPTGNLDSRIGSEIMQLMIEIVKLNGGTLLVATHDKMVEDLCGSSIHLKDGELVK